MIIWCWVLKMRLFTQGGILKSCFWCKSLEQYHLHPPHPTFALSLSPWKLGVGKEVNVRACVRMCACVTDAVRGAQLLQVNRLYHPPSRGPPYIMRPLSLAHSCNSCAIVGPGVSTPACPLLATSPPHPTSPLSPITHRHTRSTPYRRLD